MKPTDAPEFFRVCSICRTPIGFEALFFQCSVSTCNRKRLPFYFCTVSCWEAHQADARHRDAGAIEVTAPSREEREREKEDAKAEPAAPPVEMRRVEGSAARDVLVVASRLKDYVRARSGMNTSDRALSAVSDQIRQILDLAIAEAGRAGRKTVLERDVPAPKTESAATGTREPDVHSDEVLVVVSKVKQYVKERSSMNTAEAVTKVLSAHVRHLSHRAIRNAGADDRKTVLDRDYVRDR